MQKQLNNGVITVKKNSMAQFFGSVTAVTSLVLIGVGSLGLVLLQRPLQTQNFDARPQAAISSGQVLLTTTPADNSNLTVNQDTTIAIKLNTQGIQTNTINIELDLDTPTLSNAPFIEIAAESGLTASRAEVEQRGDSYLVSLTATAAANAAFSSSTPRTIANITFKPTRTGDVTLDFDNRDSQVIVLNSNPANDQLRRVNNIEFNVVNGTSASPSPSPSPSATPRVSPSPSPSASPGTGGTTLRQCNQGCSSNRECAANLTCYQNRCRLVTNVSSSSCQAATTQDQGLQRRCNEYCADSRECAAGFTCFSNRCRKPENPDSTSCAVTTTTTQQTIAKGCNQGCGSNRDCGINLRCYSGSCRLATNPSSMSCSAATTPTVSNTTNNTGKGGDSNDQQTDENTPSTGTPSSSVDTTNENGEMTASPSPEVVSNVEDTASSNTLLDKLTAFMHQQGASLPVTILGIGLGLLLLLMLLAIASRLFRRPRHTPPTVTQPVKTTESSYEKSLEQKISNLKEEKKVLPITPSSSAPPMLSNSSVPPKPTPIQTVKPVVSPATPPGVIKTAPPLVSAPPVTKAVETTPGVSTSQPATTNSFVPQVKQLNMSEPLAAAPKPAQVAPVRPVTPTTPVGAPPPVSKVVSSSPGLTNPQPIQSTPLTAPSSMLERLKQKGIQSPQDQSKPDPSQSTSKF